MTPLPASTTTLWWRTQQWDRLTPFLTKTAHTALRRFYADPDVADDIAQDTVLKCMALTEPPKHPGHFAARVARNLYLDRLKSGAAKREQNGLRGDLAVAAHDDPAPDALAQLITTREREQLRAALRHVPDDLRRPLVLQAFHGRTIAELCAQFGGDEGAMKMRLVRARQKLRAAFLALERAPSLVPAEAPEPDPAPPPRRLVPNTLSLHARFAGYLDVGTDRLFTVPLTLSPRGTA